METSTYLILLNFALPICTLSPASQLSYSGYKCSLILESDGKVNHDFFRANFTECNHVDYRISVNISQIVVMKLRIELERVHRIKDHEVMFEILNNPLEAIDVITKDDFSDPGENVRVLKFVSSHNDMILRVHKVRPFDWIPFLATYRPKGICLPDQQKCFGEDDCYYKANRCDGVWDCLENGSDELNCTGCTNSYKCQNKSSSEALCFRFSEKCNGRPMCLNGDDQRNCNEKQCNIKRDAFLCKNKRCIRSSWVCDGIDDCRDLSDESFCPSSGNNQVTVIAVTGSISCVVLSFIIIWFSCKLYLLRKKRSRERAMMRGDEALIGPGEDERDWWDFFFRDCRSSNQSRLMCHHGQHVSPIMEVQNEIFARLSAPPPYQIAMATSRSFDEVVAEEMTQRMLIISDELSDDELLNPSNSQARQNGLESDDDSLLTPEFTSEGLQGQLGTDSSISSTVNDQKSSKAPNRRFPEEHIRGSSCNVIFAGEPPSFEEATGENSENVGIGSTLQGNIRSERNSSNSDNDSGQVPPSYSSLFPPQQDAEQIPIASDVNVNQSSSNVSPRRFSFLKAPLQNLRSMFLNWSRSSNSSTLTELISNQEQVGRTLDYHIEHEIQRIVMARPLPPNVENLAGNQIMRSWTNRNGLASVEVGRADDVNLLQWEDDHPSNRSSNMPGQVNESLNVSSSNLSSLEEVIQHSWRTFNTEGVYMGDYNVGISSESENDEKDG